MLVLEFPVSSRSPLDGSPDAAGASELTSAWACAASAIRPAISAGTTATEAELIEFARGKVGPVKRPKQLVITDQPLPKSVVGKLLRRQAREIYWTPPADKV